jgi:hypothetical protein
MMTAIGQDFTASSGILGITRFAASKALDHAVADFVSQFTVPRERPDHHRSGSQCVTRHRASKYAIVDLLLESEEGRRRTSRRQSAA